MRRRLHELMPLLAPPPRSGGMQQRRDDVRLASRVGEQSPRSALPGLHFRPRVLGRCVSVLPQKISKKKIVTPERRFPLNEPKVGIVCRSSSEVLSSRDVGLAEVFVSELLDGVAIDCSKRPLYGRDEDIDDGLGRGVRHGCTAKV